jgi:hypothetical protein
VVRWRSARGRSAAAAEPTRGRRRGVTRRRRVGKRES